jgi:aminoglycoside 6'-N-acetyltransferase I
VRCKLIIRETEARDHNEWLRMRDALWPGLDVAQHVEEMARYVRDKSLAVFVVDRGDGKLGGFVEVGSRSVADGCGSSPVGYVEGWYVDGDLRRQGVGRALIEAAENWARRMGYSEMASDCLLTNDVSFQSHLRLGYKEEGRLIHFRKSLKD